MEETKIFLITYLAALLGVVPPGLVNMTVARTCVSHGKKSGMYLALGAATVVLLQALIAVLLAKYIFDNEYVRNIILRSGLVIFVLFSVYFFIMARRNTHIETQEKIPKNKSIFKGMVIATLNVFPIPYFVAIGAAINVGGDLSYDWVNIFVFSLAAATGTFTTLYVYVLSFDRIEAKAETFTEYSNYFMAILMLVLVAITLVRIFYY